MSHVHKEPVLVTELREKHHSTKLKEQMQNGRLLDHNTYEIQLDSAISFSRL